MSLAFALHEPPDETTASVWLDKNSFAFITPPLFATASKEKVVPLTFITPPLLAEAVAFSVCKLMAMSNLCFF